MFVKFILLFLITILIIIKSKKNLHMLQQNLYNENNRYLRWIKRNYKDCFNVIDFLPFLFMLFLIITEDSYIKELIYISTSILYIIAHMNEKRKIYFSVSR